jgi:formylglycine-generating enzyme required for sulfatase activity
MKNKPKKIIKPKKTGEISLVIKFGKLQKLLTRLDNKRKKIITNNYRRYRRLLERFVNRLKRRKLSHLTFWTVGTVMSVLTVFTVILVYNARKVETFQTKTYVVNGVPFEMAFVKGGTFKMGNSVERDNVAASQNEKPAHTVTVGDLYIGVHPVTQALWKVVMGVNPSYFIGDDLPVQNVSWKDCQIFIEKLNQLTKMHFHLPTEAEWEYVAQGGKKSKGYLYSGGDNIDDLGWHSQNSKLNETRVQPVGQKKHNELGIHDMSGNVWEWVNDWYDDYTAKTKHNPKGPESGTERVCRGGCWSSSEFRCRITSRNHFVPEFRGDVVGLRLAHY